MTNKEVNIDIVIDKILEDSRSKDFTDKQSFWGLLEKAITKKEKCGTKKNDNCNEKQIKKLQTNK